MAESGFDTLVKKEADTEDTLALIIRTATFYSKKPFAKKAAALLCPAGTDRLTCLRNIFNYYCRNIQYVLDELGKEVVNTPQLTVLNGKGDCKKAATFIAAVLLAAGIEPVFKHVYYDNNDEYTHIYIIVPNPDTKNYITLDPTNNCQFNKEVRYKTGSLYFVNGNVMNLHLMGNSNNAQEDIHWSLDQMMGEIDEVGCNVMGASLLHHLAHQANAVKSLSKHHPHPHLLKKLAHLPIEHQRGAFLELIKHNVGGLASGLATLLGKHPAALDHMWKEIGGDMLTMKKEILASAKKPVTPLSGMQGPEYIGKFSLKGIFHAAAGVLHTVAGVATLIPGVGPIVGGLVNKVADVADRASAAAPDINIKDKAAMNKYLATLPTDSAGTKTLPGYGFGGTHAGSFFSPAGFAFKSILLISIYHHSLNPLAESLLGTIAIAAPVIYVLLTKIKNKKFLWQ